MNTTNTLGGIRQGTADHSWRVLAIGMLAVRFVQGWIYWGGGTRRFIYGPQKLDPHGHWMAYKFQTAMPGAILGTDHVIAFLLHHFDLLYAGVVIFSAVELISGFMLITGLYTRLAALATVGLSFVLMLMFGWQGATCIDEWTMAAANFGMAITLLLVGGGAYSLDNWLLSKKPKLANSGWFRWLGGSLPLPLSDDAFKKFALILFWIAVAFIVSTYSYYRGSVVTPFHGGPVSPAKHHIGLKNGVLNADGSVAFHAYVNAGTASDPSHIVRIELQNASGSVVETWSTRILAALTKSAIHNDFAYQQFKIVPYGIAGGVGAMATLDLSGTLHNHILAAGPYQLDVISVNNHHWKLALNLAN